MMQPNSGIYKITNTKTGDFYIGSAINFKKRFGIHISTLKNQKHDNQILQKVYNKYGLEKLSFEIVEVIKDKKNLISREQYYLDNLKPKYNICKIAGSTLGYKFSNESKVKMSKAKENYVPWNVGKFHLKETKEKISITKKGKKLSEEHKKRISGGSGKKFKIKSSGGEIITNKNISSFCKKYNLSERRLGEVINNKRKSYGGYTNAN